MRCRSRSHYSWQLPYRTPTAALRCLEQQHGPAGRGAGPQLVLEHWWPPPYCVIARWHGTIDCFEWCCRPLVRPALLFSTPPSRAVFYLYQPRPIPSTVDLARTLGSLVNEIYPLWCPRMSGHRAEYNSPNSLSGEHAMDAARKRNPSAWFDVCASPGTLPTRRAPVLPFRRMSFILGRLSRPMPPVVPRPAVNTMGTRTLA